jgi:hypothetical protein
VNQTQIIAAIKAHIAKGDKAADKAEQHYIAAGQHLKTLKAQHKGQWAEWEELLKTKVGIGKSRASELMLIADGTKTLAETRAITADRTRLTRERKIASPLRSGEIEIAIWEVMPPCAHYPDSKCHRCGGQMGRRVTYRITSPETDLTSVLARLQMLGA